MPRVPDWPEYLARFHEQRPGITEDVLGHCRDRDGSPYDWLRSAVPVNGWISDLACGSAPLWPAFAGRPWVGSDLSMAELGRAKLRGATALVQADAAAEPFRDGWAAAAVCSMALMLVQPLDQALSEARRVLATGGVLVILLPSSGPLTATDRLRYGRLLLAFRRSSLAYPNDLELGDLESTLARAALTVLSDERRRFRLPIANPRVARTFVESLYLLGESGARLRRGIRVAERWVGTELGVPLRRVVARASGPRQTT